MTGRKHTAPGYLTDRRIKRQEITLPSHGRAAAARGTQRIARIVEFTAVDGSSYRVAVTDGLPPQEIHTRDVIPVIYDPQDQKNLRMDTEQGRNNGLGYLGVVVGAGIFVYGVYSLVA
jgi:hypothetical protein